MVIEGNSDISSSISGDGEEPYAIEVKIILSASNILDGNTIGEYDGYLSKKV